MSDLDGDATRRTWLANERTWLAWVRTGLTATAVALGVGKITPELAGTHDDWPYVVVGAGYALLGAALVAYGFTRRRDVDRAVQRGGYAGPDARAVAVFAVTAVVLGLATFVVVIVA
ncbi:MAG: putative rane protein [Solirubrobacteraceae bacterium]|nr:putative rane protein [Solirubrobacteraceae bacterium]